MSKGKVLGLFAFVVVAWLATLLIVTNVIPGWQERGQFGDLFGSINALFSGLAFAGLIAAILLQHEELKLQRKELKLQREEMAASRAELANQARVQTLLFRATVGQIRVAAMQARVEAIKMKGEQNQPHARNPQIEEIQSEAESMSLLAEILEDMVPDND
mgnify:CR=1 FL=1